MFIPPRSRRLLSYACALALAVCVATLASPASADWMQFHAGPARLGLTASSTLYPSNIGKLKVAWSRATGSSAGGINSSPAVANGRVFIGSDDGRLYAFSTNGSALWSAGLGGPVRSSPAVDGSTVVVGSDHGVIQARSVSNGALKWSHTVGGVVSSPPLIADGRVYIGSRGGTFFAFNESTGKLVWKQKTWSVWDAAAYRSGTVYVGSDESRVWAFDSDTGHRKWVTNVFGRVRSTPAVTDHRVYVGTDQGRLIALDRGTGHQVWSSAVVSPGNGYVRCAPAVADGLVVVSVGMTTTPMDGKLRAFRVTGGGLAWTGEMADYSTSSPAFVHGMFIAGSFDHRLYAFGADHGNQLWTSGWASQNGFFNRGISGSPAISGGRIYIGVRDGRLYALSLS